MTTVTSRIVTEIYQGIDFPPAWADRTNGIGVGMERDVAASVAAMFDAQRRPVALCWRIGASEERFASVPPGAPGDASLVEGLNEDLARESLRFGTEDLFGTLVWAPGELRPEHGLPVHMVPFGRGHSGWNIPPRSLVTRANELLMITRCVDEGLAIPAPASLEDMHQHMATDGPALLVLLPGGAPARGEGTMGKKMALLFGGLIAAGIVICAYLLGAG